MCAKHFVVIDGEELYRRGYRVASRGQSHALLAPGNVRLKRDQRVEFSNGEKVAASELAQRLNSHRAKPSVKQIIAAARRQHRRKCKYAK